MGCLAKTPRQTSMCNGVIAGSPKPQRGLAGKADGRSRVSLLGMCPTSGLSLLGAVEGMRWPS